jgi:hypothetical protein
MLDTYAVEKGVQRSGITLGASGCCGLAIGVPVGLDANGTGDGDDCDDREDRKQEQSE